MSLNELRAGPRFRKEGLKEACSDGMHHKSEAFNHLFLFLTGFFLNFCSVLLLLCKPFMSSHDASGQKLGLIDHAYPTSPLCRLDQINETCLARGVISEWVELRGWSHY